MQTSYFGTIHKLDFSAFSQEVQKMKLNIGSLVLVTLFAGGIVPSTATTYCEHNCSPSQINAVFRRPSYLFDTKSFCRKFLNFPDVTTIRKTQTAVFTRFVSLYYTSCYSICVQSVARSNLEILPSYRTATTIKTKTANPVTVTKSDVKVPTFITNEIIFITDARTSTISDTSTILETFIETVTETTQVVATTNIMETTTVSETATVTTTSSIYTTATTFTSAPPARMKKRIDLALKEHIVKRRGYSYAFKIPFYLPQDLSPPQISSACKMLNPCPLTKTSTIISTLMVKSYKTLSQYVTVTPIVSATITRTRTSAVPNKVTETVYTTNFATKSTIITLTVATFTKTASIETQVIATETVTTSIAIITSTVTVVTTAVQACGSGIVICDLSHPESCCSGRCVKFFQNPNCCVGGGQVCDIFHPEGCCGGTCAIKGDINVEPRIYTCVGG
ncbi:hypothetical protein H072_11392 [Dactylellina haptotyla CBS 200.50]|uniref:Uncharacterized protein n=1 Tax=Dactylellina haptotyla (strain CBS 200.50) TaxID=1284197 RepID=S7ZXS0_DACHA|nr:hypothetical protein H072_11392 [Dactylellina haptotyla CBS 200.50]